MKMLLIAQLEHCYYARQGACCQLEHEEDLLIEFNMAIDVRVLLY